ncbi:TPA: O28ac/O42 family O-antigen polymerase [Escherichia coli]|nr:O28ac/O42 family O-antigen polymerase [Escherichia coli]
MKQARIKPFSYLSLSFFVLFLIFLNISAVSFDEYLTDLQYSYAYVLFAISLVAVYYAQGESYTSLGFLFNTCLFLFIGGRFIATTFGIDSESVFTLDFMTTYIPTSDEKLEIYTRVVSFQIFLNLGYLFLRKEDSLLNLNKNNNSLPGRLLFLIVIVLFLLCLVEQYSMLSKAMSEGYLARYGDQAESYDAGAAFKYTLLFVFTGLLFATCKKKYIIINFMIYMTLATIIILIGARGAFVSTILMGVWLYGLNKKISLKKLSIIFLSLAGILLIIMNFSARGNYYSNELIDSLLRFLYDQGNTLAVVGYVRTITDYPVFAYISTFLPGSSFFASMFHGGSDLNSYMLSFPAYANYVANPNMYFAGYGLGWSIISSVEMFSADILFIFCIFSVLIGMFLKFANEQAKRNSFWFGAVACLCAKILFTARADIKTIIPLFMYYAIMYLIISTAMRILRQRYG